MIVFNPDLVNDVEIGDFGMSVPANGTRSLDNIPENQIRSSVDLHTLISAGTLQLEQAPGAYYSPSQALVVLAGQTSPVNGVDVITRYRFWARFTLTEKQAMENSTDSLVKVVLKNLELAEYIDLNDPDVSPALDILVAYGIITSARKTEILTY